MNFDKGSLVRTFVLFVALINQFLVASGLNPIPGSEDVWFEIGSAVFTFIAGGINWFKNNYITAKGLEQKEVLKKEGLTNAK